MARKRIAESAHPGSFIRHSVLPPGLSVEKAAELLGVSRPALSNLLNGKASLSSEMALRLQKAFGAKGEDLLKRQALFDESRAREMEKEIAVRAYTAGFMNITAQQIAAWADKLEARSLLSVLLRKLISSTGANITQVDFPAYENSQRKGWDGRVQTDTATPWIPAGSSGWEFGCDKTPQQKAEEDYSARLRSIPPKVRRETTFVFVTPRWHAKGDWAKRKRARNEWKDVRAFDASDLEQWLEQSVPAQSWLAERLGVAIDGVMSLDECWKQWAGVTDPELKKELFGEPISIHKGDFGKWLSRPPGTNSYDHRSSPKVKRLALSHRCLEEIGTSPSETHDSGNSHSIGRCSATSDQNIVKLHR